MKLNQIEQIVSNELSIDIQQKTHKEEVVQARYIFFQIARGEGYNKSEIARHIGMHYSSVINGLYNFKLLMKQDETFGIKFSKCIEVYSQLKGFGVDDLNDFIENKKFTLASPAGCVEVIDVKQLKDFFQL